MQPSDYRRIESELQQQVRQTTLGSVPAESLNRKGWSTGYIGLITWIQNFRLSVSNQLIINISDDSDEEFHPFEPSAPHDKAINYITSSHVPLSPSTS